MSSFGAVLPWVLPGVVLVQGLTILCEDERAVIKD